MNHRSPWKGTSEYYFENNREGLEYFHVPFKLDIPNNRSWEEVPQSSLFGFLGWVPESSDMWYEMQKIMHNEDLAKEYQIRSVNL